LKRCREAAGLTQESVSREFEWHTAKVTRIETARVAVTPRDVKDLLTLYGVQDERYREELMNLARQSRERTWWTDYRDLIRPGSFIGLEAGASAMRAWEPTVVPGLLQTEDYIRALIRSGRSSDPDKDIDRRVSLRMIRQDRLTGVQPLDFFAVIDESVLTRMIGSEDVMAGQLERLIERAQLPNVTVRILPMDAGAHPFLGGPAALLEFYESTHMDVVYLEGIAGDYYAEQPSEVARYRQDFERLSARALDDRMSIKLIESLLRT
jgi:hypothetical protein